MNWKEIEQNYGREITIKIKRKLKNIVNREINSRDIEKAYKEIMEAENAKMSKLQEEVI